ncbi:hypothetical protein RA280_19535 [Cupriavidus sp. CV2]|uniref:hypothetical protein n=1 Tax=Cupriavidus ulmosensis TaxID=3065913 RepID=UPI00296B1405|nr:hypothetical protein [Cupriavidus sp. CV2]MDW3683895.1 hypothetical protein [Cupriavidus sp. CV2]
MTKERPIRFSGAMVRAILDGRKTQTRQTMKPQPTAGLDGWDWSWPIPGKNVTPGTFDRWRADAKNPLSPRYCPYGQPGDRLWVREAFSGPYCMEARPGCAAIPPSKWGRSSRIWYWADGDPSYGDWTKPRPSIHMPRWASRILLEITGVCVERLNDCSEADARAEGIAPELDGWTDYSNPSCQMCVNPVDSYRTLWDSINGAGTWEANPWVWVVEFRCVDSAPLAA